MSHETDNRVSLHREINALGGVPADRYDAGYNDAISDVLAILERRGFSEQSDASLRATIEGLERRDVHDGYDTRGNYIWVDHVRLSDVLAVIADREAA